jgi:hypothetical protein
MLPQLARDVHHMLRPCRGAETRIGSITGHTEQKAKTEAFRTYSQGASMEELAGYVELVDYPEI